MKKIMEKDEIDEHSSIANNFNYIGLAYDLLSWHKEVFENYLKSS